MTDSAKSLTTREPVAVAAAARVLILAAIGIVCAATGVALTAPVVAAIGTFLVAVEGMAAVLTRSAVTPNENVAVSMKELDAAVAEAEGLAPPQ